MAGPRNSRSRFLFHQAVAVKQTRHPANIAKFSLGTVSASDAPAPSSAVPHSSSTRRQCGRRLQIPLEGKRAFSIAFPRRRSRTHVPRPNHHDHPLAPSTHPGQSTSSPGTPWPPTTTHTTPARHLDASKQSSAASLQSPASLVAASTTQSVSRLIYFPPRPTANSQEHHASWDLPTLLGLIHKSVPNNGMISNVPSESHPTVTIVEIEIEIKRSSQSFPTILGNIFHLK